MQAQCGACDANALCLLLYAILKLSIVKASRQTRRDGDSVLSIQTSCLNTCGFELIRASGPRTLVLPSGEECVELVKVCTTTSDAGELSKLWREQQHRGEISGLCG